MYLPIIISFQINNTAIINIKKKELVLGTNESIYLFESII